jgi:hypothetical protein
MRTIAYVSSAVNLFNDSELNDLLEKSRKRNHAAGITGMLLYKDGDFMQFIEGPKESVDALLARIRLDPRHRGIIVLLQEEQHERQFADWSMGFKKLDPGEAPAIPGYSDFMNTPLNSNQFVSDPSKALTLLMGFRKIAR